MHTNKTKTSKRNYALPKIISTDTHKKYKSFQRKINFVLGNYQLAQRLDTRYKANTDTYIISTRVYKLKKSGPEIKIPTSIIDFMSNKKLYSIKVEAKHANLTELFEQQILPFIDKSITMLTEEKGSALNKHRVFTTATRKKTNTTSNNKVGIDAAAAVTLCKFRNAVTT